MLTPEELVDQLAAELYHAIVKPRRYAFEDLSDDLRDDYRDGARAALRWLHEATDPVDVTPGQVAIDELLR
jgi:hypothetical protein